MVATAPGGDDIGCRSFNTIPRVAGLAPVRKMLVMSIWTDLLALGGYVATPAGLAALETTSPADAAPRPAAPARPARPPRARARVASGPRPLPPANKISPNDLW